jgi:hypothetical protein
MTPDDAARVAAKVLGEPVASARRFATGAGNWVYDVIAQSGERVVVRFMRSRDEFDAAIFWNRTLRPLGVPLPRLVAQADEFDNVDHPGEWLVLERFAGHDLGHAYPALTAAEKLSILDRVIRAQAIVQSLPAGDRFGYATLPGAQPHRNWSDAIAENLQRSRLRMIEVGAVDAGHVARVERFMPAFADYFATVRPLPFLDDTTTRNVIVHEGVLQGIVDVDGVCYGDELLVPALTRMALLSLGCDTYYTDAWLDRLEATGEQRRVFDFYTAVFAVNFLGEQGQQFNRERPPPIDEKEVNRLVSILDSLLQRIA